MCFYQPNIPPCTCTFLQLIQPCQNATYYPSPSPHTNPNLLVRACAYRHIAKGVGQRFCALCGSSNQQQQQRTTGVTLSSVEFMEDVNVMDGTVAAPVTMSQHTKVGGVSTIMETMMNPGARSGSVASTRRGSESRRGRGRGRSQSIRASVSPHNKDPAKRRGSRLSLSDEAGSASASTEPVSENGNGNGIRVAPLTPPLEDITEEGVIGEEKAQGVGLGIDFGLGLGFGDARRKDSLAHLLLPDFGPGPSPAEQGVLAVTPHSDGILEDVGEEGQGQDFGQDHGYVDYGRRISDLFSENGDPVEQERQEEVNQVAVLKTEGEDDDALKVRRESVVFMLS
ncbi:hypothetical protein BDW59DRAFT_155722 [Aspergillus cavernicola]|uniref:Uncharacterized protein n=1 Tax=Aspergillus cavernicola TaxID=176166 RepID=A0ABR4J515_9EURO